MLDRQDIKQSPAIVADDVLRQIPTFSLFRRTSSLASHPTTQGVSLRGIGPSGVSRTLVLLDGVPFNDPFGGWVYWSRVPLESADRIEVVDGSSSSLYGNYAMGGVINFVTNPATPTHVRAEGAVRQPQQPKVDFLGSHVWGKLGVAVDGNVFDTDGYADRARERARTRRQQRGRAFLESQREGRTTPPTDRVRAFFRAGYFDENRDNGKASTIDGTEEANDTTWRVGEREACGSGCRTRAICRRRCSPTSRRSTATFSRCPCSTPARNIGRMTLTQTVPTTSVGGMAQWSRAFGPKQYFTAGTDWRWVDGDSEENGLDARDRHAGHARARLGRHAAQRRRVRAGPDRRRCRSSRSRSARGVDSWRNYDGHNLETMPSGADR